MEHHLAVIVALLRAELTPLEYLVVTGWLFDNLSEAALAEEISASLTTAVSRTRVHRLKRSGLAAVRRELAS